MNSKFDEFDYQERVTQVRRTYDTKDLKEAIRTKSVTRDTSSKSSTTTTAASSTEVMLMKVSKNTMAPAGSPVYEKVSNGKLLKLTAHEKARELTKKHHEARASIRASVEVEGHFQNAIAGIVREKSNSRKSKAEVIA